MKKQCSYPILFSVLFWGLLGTACRPKSVPAGPGNFKEETVFRDADTTQNIYLALIPQHTAKGLLVILPGFGTLPAEVLTETKLAEAAAKRGYAVIIPLLASYTLMDTANLYQSRLKTLIPEVLARYNIPAGNFILGGHSLGGHEALYYTEKAFADSNSLLIRPQFVFGVDPPLDFKRLYRNYRRLIALDPTLTTNSEAAFMTERFEVLYGGTPDTQPDRYTAASSFSVDVQDGGNARYLRGLTLPVRLYSDPDSAWYRKERNTPMEWTNTADLQACVDLLKKSGTPNAHYISCLGKGFLSDGRRHPHAFSILDVDDFLAWITSNQ